MRRLDFVLGLVVGELGHLEQLLAEPQPSFGRIGCAREMSAHLAVIAADALRLAREKFDERSKIVRDGRREFAAVAALDATAVSHAGSRRTHGIDRLKGTS